MADSPLTVLIADDEPLARQRIADLLAREEGIEVAGTARDGEEAIEAIRSLRPGLVFLDIQMPGRTGLEVVAAVGPERMPATIFVTAFDQHALKAFELAAVDYLVKPFDDDRFAQALARARERIRLQEVERITRRLLAVMGAPPATAPAAPPAAPAGAYLRRLEVESRGVRSYVPVEAIDYIGASGPYAELHVAGRVHLVRERMQALEQRLDPERFVRVHRSVIVPLDRVASLQREPT